MMVSVVYFLLFFSIFLVVLVLHFLNHKKAPAPASEKPLVSILIAVRNEEATISSCLDAISRLDYPVEKLEILLGDDASTDNTLVVINNYIKDKAQFKCIQIKEKLGQAKGKANVLAHLTKQATSDYFFITDADISLPPNWVQNMLGGLENNVGIITGITTIKGDSLFQRFQAIDWVNALSLMQVVSNLNLPVSTMGNNMLITRQAYEATGGYENMPFSVTEDVQLFKAVVKKGFGFLNIFDVGVLAQSAPAPNWLVLLHQRKRWMQGIWHLPWYMSLFLIVYAAFYTFYLPFGLYTSWQIVAGIFLAKVFLQTLFINRSLQYLKLQYPIWQLIFFEFYVIFVSLITILFFLLPVKVAWKERKY
ncbi:glycosyltransferase [Adhaeribacter aquaticus]|uniref:glycosyltransferase n=1 Tax=Adhaeribacter aquaticus TaxID=299567 RepID=UPI000684B9A7|nr:glycosyltransferase [Adhaeribacter aquaticus]